MSQLTADQYRAVLDSVARDPAMAPDNVQLPRNAVKGLTAVLFGVGVVGLLATLMGGFIYTGKHALAAYWVGVLCVTAVSLGGMFWTLVMHSTMTGWGVTVRRQFENLMMNLPLCIGFAAIFLIIELASGGILLNWIGIDPSTNVILNHKKGWLNEPFLVVRFLIYALVWVALATKLWRYSTEQDRSGDRFLSNKARRTSAWGLLAFALSTAFFAFDYIMALDFRFFSTMWGVYYFASTTFSSVAVVLVILALLRLKGRLTGAVTNEHTHDLGKLLFGFTVFWAYIAFSQYFLIWYSNIPEETAWYNYRKQGGWQNVAAMLAIGHFIIPFLIMLIRGVKRHPASAAAVGLWMLFMLVMDMVWLVRPMVYLPGSGVENPGPGAWWVDIAGLVGVAGIWGGALVARIGKGPLIPLKDPRLPEALGHRNWV